MLNLLAGSLVSAWLGASWARRMATATLYRVLAVQLVAGVAAAFGIGVVAALMGVAGGELLIPTLVPLLVALLMFSSVKVWRHV